MAVPRFKSGPYTVFIAVIALLGESVVAFLVISAPVTKLERWLAAHRPFYRDQPKGLIS